MSQTGAASKDVVAAPTGEWPLATVVPDGPLDAKAGNAIAKPLNSAHAESINSRR